MEAPSPASRPPPFAGAEAPAYHVATGRLRAFLVFLVVVHHGLLAYYPDVPPHDRFVGGPMLWRIFPVLDSERSPLVPLLTSFNDVFFMALLFLLSGLFVQASVERKGLGRFLRDRGLRLGLPFAFSAGLVTPAAYYPAWLQAGGEPGLGPYVEAWTALGIWPTGPAWFVLLLLVYDGVAALLFRLRPDWVRLPARLARGARERPLRLFASVAGLSFAVYAPLALLYGSEHWTYLGPLQFQTSRVLHYFVYFALGVGIGAVGLSRGLLAPDGRLARRWGAWTAAMLGAFTVAAAVFLATLGSEGPTRTLLRGVGSLTFALSCAASSFAFLAIFTRFAGRPRPLWRAAADHAYGIYLVHYAFVAWCQLALGEAPLPALAKAALVVAAAWLLAFATTALLRRIPGVARLV